MRVLFCDRCGNEIKQNDPYATVVMQGTPEVVGEMFLSGSESRWDMCRICSLEIQTIISVKKTPSPPRPRIEKPPAIESRGL